MKIQKDLEKSKDLDDVIMDAMDAPISNNAKTIRLSVWATALLLIVVQAIFLKYWTIITSILTLVLAFFVAEFLVRTKKIGMILQAGVHHYRTDIILWSLAVVAIVVEAVLLKWWVCLTGIATLIVVYLIKKVIWIAKAYFNGELDE